MSTGVSLSNALNNYAPILVELQDCTFVRETFSDIYRDHCPGLSRYSRWIYIGLVMVSTSVMLSLLLWVIYGRERRHRVYTKELMAESAQGAEGEKESWWKFLQHSTAQNYNMAFGFNSVSGLYILNASFVLLLRSMQLHSFANLPLRRPNSFKTQLQARIYELNVLVLIWIIKSSGLLYMRPT